MIKRYVLDLDSLKNMSDEQIYNRYHKVEWLIGNGDSIDYIIKKIKSYEVKF